MGEGKAEKTPITTAEIEELRKYSMEADLRAAEARAALEEAERRLKVQQGILTLDISNNYNNNNPSQSSHIDTITYNSILPDDATPSNNLKTKLSTVMAPKKPRDTSILDDATRSKILKTKRKSRFRTDKMRTDPEVKASYKKIRSDPAYREMRKQMKYLHSDPNSKQFDWEVYLSAAKQFMNNKELDEDRERIRSALNEDTSKSGEESVRAKFAPAFSAILDEIKEGGPAVRERYFTEPESFRKYIEAVNLTINGGTASSDDVTSLNVVVKPGDVTESTVDQKIHDDAEGLKNAPDSAVEDMELDGVRIRSTLDLLKEGSWLIPTTENVKDPLLKSWIERGIALGAYDSALHLAAFFGKKICVTYLLKNGADAILENSKGYLPIELAEYAERSDVVELLEEYS